MSASGSPAPSQVDDTVSSPANDHAIGNAPRPATPTATATAPASPKANATAIGSANGQNGDGNSKIKTTYVAAPRPRLKSGHSTPNMNGPLYMQTSGNSVVLVRRLKRKDESTWKHLTRWFVENQIGTST